MRKRIQAGLLVLSMLITTPSLGISKEKARSKKVQASSEPATSVALIPYTDSMTPEMQRVIRSLEKNLRDQKGLRVLDRKSTSTILSYYLQHARETAESGDGAEHLRQAREAFARGEYEAADGLARTAEATIRSGIGTISSNASLRDLLILKAKLAYVKGGKNKDLIRGIYSEILRLDPTITYAKGLYSGWEHKALDEAKKEMEQLRTGRIEIVSDPKNGEVYLNGQRKGVTYYEKPFLIEQLPAGQHCIEVRTVHYRPYRECFQLSENGTKYISARLERETVANGEKIATVSPKQFRTPQELSNLISVLGAQMGVDKIILVHETSADSPHVASYQVGDANLGAVNKIGSLDAQEGSVKQLTQEMQRDVLAKPGDRLVSQGVGDIALLEKRRKPIYKRPLFWILTGLAAAGGGVGAIFLGAGAAAATTGGLLVAF